MLVAVAMGSTSDWDTLQAAVQVLEELEVPTLVRVVSAHRTPHLLEPFCREVEAAGAVAIVAGAGGAAHLPGMLAAHTVLPVLGVPVESRVLRGVDSLLSIVQMPAGVPVGTLAIGHAGAVNAGLLAAAIAATADPALSERLRAWRAARTAAVEARPDPREP